MLIVDGRCRASEIVDLVDFNIQGLGDIVSYDFEPGIAQQFIDVTAGAGKKIVDTKNFAALLKQDITQVRP
jgi:hypothetical protein